MKLILRMTTDEIRNRYGIKGTNKDGYVFCRNCPCCKKDYHVCTRKHIFPDDTKRCDGYEIAYERIKECTKTVAEVPLRIVILLRFRQANVFPILEKIREATEKFVHDVSVRHISE